MEKDLYFQKLRGIAIIAVVLIHSCSYSTQFIGKNINGDFTLVLRQFINFAVPLFLFLAGYFVNVGRFKSEGYNKKFIEKRLLRILIPYCFWSLMVIVIKKDLNIIRNIYYLITGQVVSIYYYIIVLTQLTLLTKFFIRKNIKDIYVYTLNILTITFLYLFSIKGIGIPFPWNVLSFTAWVIFYYYGVKVGNSSDLQNELKYNIKKNTILYFIFLILSVIEGFLWTNFGDINMAISQIKFTSFLMSIYLIKVLVGIKNKFSKNTGLLTLIGDYSFGIYLIHIFILPKVNNILIGVNLFRQFQPLLIISVFLITLIICFIIIRVTRKILGSEKATNILGF